MSKKVIQESRGRLFYARRGEGEVLKGYLDTSSALIK